jgi:DNA-directed RNA polymerase subunit L
MNPKVSGKTENDGVLTFTLSNTNVSIANAIRRVILSDIKAVVFRTFPHNENRVDIKKNTTRLTNEMIKQRIGCVPINMQTDAPLEDYEIHVNVKNNTTETMYITTKDFKIKNKSLDKFLSDAEQRTIFRSNQMTGDNILIARLLPGFEKTEGQTLNFVATLDIGTAKEDGMYAVASNSCYSNTIAPDKVDTAWSEEVTKLESDGMTKEQIADYRKNWLVSNAQRHFLENSFDFKIETVGVYQNDELVEQACDIVLNKIERFNNSLQMKTTKISTTESTIDNCYDVVLEGEDYTLGKVLEYILFNNYYQEKILTFCGFKKFHPHDDDSIIRIAFTNKEEMPIIYDTLIEVCGTAAKLFENIKQHFTIENE